jgi:hypothetical protein
MNVNDFITTAENVYAEDIAISRLIDKVNPEEMTVVNKDLGGLPLPVGIYDEETGKVVVEDPSAAEGSGSDPVEEDDPEGDAGAGSGTDLGD